MGTECFKGSYQKGQALTAFTQPCSLSACLEINFLMCPSSYYAIGVITQANLAFSIWKRIDLFNSSIGIIDCEGEAEAWKDLMGKAH